MSGKGFEDLLIFEAAYTAAVAEATRIADTYNFQSNHVPIARILADQNIKHLAHLSWRISQLHPMSKDRKAITQVKVKLLFSSLGHGNIDRFQNTDHVLKFENHNCSEFMVKQIMFIIRDHRTPVQDAMLFLPTNGMGRLVSKAITLTRITGGKERSRIRGF